MFPSLVACFRALFLPVEQTTMVTERRDRVRIACRVPAYAEEYGRMVPVTIVDLSLQGICLRFKKPPRGKTLRLRCDLDDEPTSFQPVPLECEVKWTRRLPATGERLVGCKFGEANAEYRENWVRRLLRSISGPSEFPPQQRFFLRPKGNILVDISDLEARRLADGETLNLSAGGLLMQTQGSLDYGMRVRVKLAPRGKLRGFECYAEVLDHRHEKAGEHRLYSLRFISLTKAMNKQLAKYVLLLLRESQAGLR